MVIRVFLADDHTVVREGLTALLEAEKDINVVGFAENGNRAIEKIRRSKPDVVIMDIMMPEMNGIEASRYILDEHPNLPIIVLSIQSSSEHINRALKAGIAGYLLKESAGKEVIEAIRTVVSGDRYISKKISDIVVENIMLQKENDATESVLDRLSPRERQILELVVDGKTSAEIGESLSLSPKTVDTYRSRFMIKIGVKDIPSLVKFAIRSGITD